MSWSAHWVFPGLTVNESQRTKKHDPRQPIAAFKVIVPFASVPVLRWVMSTGIKVSFSEFSHTPVLLLPLSKSLPLIKIVRKLHNANHSLHFKAWTFLEMIFFMSIGCHRQKHHFDMFDMNRKTELLEKFPPILFGLHCWACWSEQCWTWSYWCEDYYRGERNDKN